jgi:hypothetical protein
MATKHWFYCLVSTFWAMAGLTNLALAGNNQALPQAVDVRIDNGQDALLQLEVKQVSLDKVLKLVSTKTGIPIHYSVLPEGLMTATCVGKGLKPVLECLLDHKADVIVRYKSQPKKGTIETDAIAEAWVLGAKLEALPANALCQQDGNNGNINFSGDKQTKNSDKALLTKPSQSDYLLKIVEDGSPEDRAQAIGDLLMIGAHDDPKVKEMLEQAVHDQDENIRAQAISTLTHREDYSEHAPEIIREALQDPSVDVRLMAVDGIGDDASLLELAVDDPDETVRSFATTKLDELRKQGQTEN